MKAMSPEDAAGVITCQDLMSIQVEHLTKRRGKLLLSRRNLIRVRDE